MSSLSFNERIVLEKYFWMSSGYVLDFSDRTFGEFVEEATGVNIHSEKYQIEGTSKAKKLRAFWKIESDHLVGTLLRKLIDHGANLKMMKTHELKAVEKKCRYILNRLIPGGPGLSPLKDQAKALDANYLLDQIKRIESSIETDPGLAIGTAKELIETCCKTILSDRGKSADETSGITVLMKQVMKELRLVPENIPASVKGSETVRRVLHNLGAITQGLAELRNLYGTGHGKHGKTLPLQPRHAKLAVGAASTLTIFLLDTHLQHKS